MYISDFNENIYNSTLTPFSCAYLHNYTEKNPEPLKEALYEKVLKESPIYFKDDYEKLELFIKKHVGYGSGKEILYEIESGNIKPSKKLIEHVSGLFKGNKEFHLLDEQKVSYEMALDVAKTAAKKTVVIIKGGPGTGKSVISMSLLGGLLQNKMNVVFVAPNSSFREVMLDKLTQGKDNPRAKFLLSGSGRFFGAKKNIYDVIVVDEAHRLKNGKAFMYKGENQIEDIINSSKISILFIDEDQIIRPEDIGTIEEIKRIGLKYEAEFFEMELTSQFRCSGADGFVNWISDVLRIKDTANFDGWDKKEFEFKIFKNPNEMRSAIQEKSANGFNARLLAGFAWPWSLEKEGNSNSQVNDVVVPEFNFAMPWNSRKVGTTWAINQDGINQIGCVHTSQGLEFDYVGIFVGNDLKMNSETNEFFTELNCYKDRKGKEGLSTNLERVNQLVRNIYRILFTRGMKGCYVYFTDKAVEKYFIERLEKAK